MFFSSIWSFVTYKPGQDIAERNVEPISIAIPNMNRSHQMVWKLYALKNTSKNVDDNANADSGGSA